MEDKECFDHLLIVEGKFLVHNEHLQRFIKVILKSAISVHQNSSETASKELHPLFLHLVWVKLIVYILLWDAFQVPSHLFESVIGFLTILQESVIDFGCVSARLWDVILQERNLIMMAEFLEHVFESFLIDVSLSEYAHFLSF